MVIMDDVAAAPGKNVNLNGTLRVCERGLRVRICNNGKLGAELFDVKRTMATNAPLQERAFKKFRTLSQNPIMAVIGR